MDETANEKSSADGPARPASTPAPRGIADRPGRCTSPGHARPTKSTGNWPGARGGDDRPSQSWSGRCSASARARYPRRLRDLDEVYGGRDLRRAIRALRMGNVLAVRAKHALTLGAGRALTEAEAVKLIPYGAWQRMRSGHSTKGSRITTGRCWR